jgi:protocatechuate 3,4-dioxygenase, beta subunit
LKPKNLKLEIENLTPMEQTASKKPIIQAYRRHEPGSQPPSLHEPYRATVLRSPRKPLVFLPHTLSETTGPVYGHDDIAEADHDLTRQHAGEPLGERIVVTGRVLDGGGSPVPNTLIEIWQANSAGRYVHVKDQHPAPLDPNFTGTGRTLTDENGAYRFITIKPGPYPWLNHYNAWRPAHIHFSVFGRAFITRLVTQMYFPGDPLFAFDPIFQTVPDEKARQRMISKFDLETTQPEWATGYKFDIVLRGPEATLFEK